MTPLKGTFSLNVSLIQESKISAFRSIFFSSLVTISPFRLMKNWFAYQQHNFGSNEKNSPYQSL